MNPGLRIYFRSYIHFLDLHSHHGIYHHVVSMLVNRLIKLNKWSASDPDFCLIGHVEHLQLKNVEKAEEVRTAGIFVFSSLPWDLVPSNQDVGNMLVLFFHFRCFSHHPWKRLRVIEICLMFVPTVLSKSKVESDPVAMILYTTGDILLMDKIQSQSVSSQVVPGCCQIFVDL